MSKNIFSFCLYGHQKKYCEGLLENIQIIEKDFPDFEIWIYLGLDVPQEYINKYRKFNKIKVINVSDSLKCSRFFAIDNEECNIMICRDADSRIHSRDIWCIKEFINSTKKCHIIRDHYWHKDKISAGMWAVKCGLIPS